MIYCAVLTVGLGLFGYTTHKEIMNNVTTNEKIRKKWNAS